MSFSFRDELKRLPDRPGVYLMKDASGAIIYVGKAKSLKNRVRSYFQSGNKAPKVRIMVGHVARFDYILVDTEVEALVLESNLIKEYRPRYNILLKDDKSYPFIKITNERFPRILKVRRLDKDGSRYFGPYPNVLAVNELIDLLHELYPLRTCNLDFDRVEKRSRPCLNYDMKRCDGMCVGKGDEEEYNWWIEEILTFFKEQGHFLEDRVTREMHAASDRMEYEKAARMRDALELLPVIHEKQNITSVRDVDYDACALYEESGYAAVSVFILRGGRIIGNEDFFFENAMDLERGELLSQFVEQYYSSIEYFPSEILLSEEPSDTSVIEAFLSNRAERKIAIHTPKIGKKKDLMEKLTDNAKNHLERNVRALYRKEAPKRALEGLSDLLGIENIFRIEAYDISNLAGTLSVGSMVVFQDGVKAPKEYRKFRIKTVAGSDDYESMREVIRRRLNRLIEGEKEGFSTRPDLILMDGGKGQVSAALDVLRELALDIPVAGMVKDDRHRTRGLIYRGEELPMEQTSASFRLLYAIQEEAHRFAINYHKSLRTKKMTHSILDDIEGIGPARRAKLMEKFGSVEEISKQNVEDIMSCGIPETIAKRVLEQVRRKG